MLADGTLLIFSVILAHLLRLSSKLHMNDLCPQSGFSLLKCRGNLINCYSVDDWDYCHILNKGYHASYVRKL